MPIWPIRCQGNDAFGGAVLDPCSAEEAMDYLARAKIDGLITHFSAHDDDLVSWDPEKPEDYLHKGRLHQHLESLRDAAQAADLRMNIVTCNLHGHPIFANGGFTNPNPDIRLLAVKKALRAAWIGNFLGAQGITYWVARDGFEVPAAVSFDGMRGQHGPYTWIRQALNIISSACLARGGSIKFGTIEVKCNEPRGVMFLPLVGSALALISLLKHPEFWMLNPEVLQHSAMASQEPLIEIVQAIDHDKLPFIHLGSQIDGQFDNDFRPLAGPTGLKRTVMIMLYLAECNWNGIVEFDCHPFRAEMSPGASNASEIRKRFILESVEMYRMVEQVIVPRLLDNMMFQMARKQITNPPLADILPGSGGVKSIDILETGHLEKIVGSRVDLDLIRKNPPDISDVDRLFNMIIAGVSPQDLALAMA